MRARGPLRLLTCLVLAARVAVRSIRSTSRALVLYTRPSAFYVDNRIATLLGRLARAQLVGYRSSRDVVRYMPIWTFTRASDRVAAQADRSGIVVFWSAAARLILAQPALELVVGNIVGLQSVVRALVYRQRLTVFAAERQSFATVLGRLARGHLARMRLRSLEQSAAEGRQLPLELLLATPPTRPQLTLATSSAAARSTDDDSGACSLPSLIALTLTDASSLLSDASSNGPATPDSSSIDLPLPSSSVAEAEGVEEEVEAAATKPYRRRIRGGARKRRTEENAVARAAAAAAEPEAPIVEVAIPVKSVTPVAPRPSRSLPPGAYARKILAELRS